MHLVQVLKDKWDDRTNAIDNIYYNNLLLTFECTYMHYWIEVPLFLC